MLSLYKRQNQKLKESEKYYLETLSLPIFFDMTLKQVNFVAKSIVKITNQHKKSLFK